MPMYALCIYGSHIVSSVFPLSSQNVGSSACMTRSCSSGMTSTLTTSCRGWRQLKTSMRGTWLRLFCLVSVNEKIEVWWRPYCITSKVAVVQDAYEGKWMWWSRTTRGLSWWGVERILKHTHTPTTYPTLLSKSDSDSLDSMALNQSSQVKAYIPLSPVIISVTLSLSPSLPVWSSGVRMGNSLVNVNTTVLSLANVNTSPSLFFLYISCRFHISSG